MTTEAGKRTSWSIHAAAPHTHEQAYMLLEKYLNGFDGLKICDAPCGAGSFSNKLLEAGARVWSLDIERHPALQIPESGFALADLNYGLPFPEGSLDVVASIEGIEHLENPTVFVMECARVVKSGGLVVITTPNVDSFRSRRYVFMNGYHKFFTPVSASQRAHGHVHPIDIVFIHRAAKKAGLELIDIAVNEITEKNIWLKNLLRNFFTRRFPDEVRDKVPFFGDIAIYLLRKV